VVSDWAPGRRRPGACVVGCPSRQHANRAQRTAGRDV